MVPPLDDFPSSQWKEWGSSLLIDGNETIPRMYCSIGKKRCVVANSMIAFMWKLGENVHASEK